MDDELRNIARALRKMAEAKLEMGDVAGADVALKRADEILSGRLPPPKVSSSVPKMPGNYKARNKAIALSKASTPLHLAAVHHESYGSLSNWSRAHGFPVSTVNAAAKGNNPAQAQIDAQARKDFPGVFKVWNWPKGIT